MSNGLGAEVAELHLVNADELKRNWAWFLSLGFFLVIMGFAAISLAAFVTLATVVLFGWLLIGGGVIQAGHAFWRKKWGGFFVDIVTGILYVVVGLMVVASPAATAATLTLLIAMFLILGGILRIVAALSVRYQNRTWLLLHGIIVLLLGISIWNGWPLSGLWVIGLFIGIEMTLNGWTLIMLGLAAKRENRASA